MENKTLRHEWSYDNLEMGRARRIEGRILWHLGPGAVGGQGGTFFSLLLLLFLMIDEMPKGAMYESWVLLSN